MTAAMLPESYDPVLVALSYAVALLGSYTALSFVARLTDSGGRLRVGWLLGGAFAQGTGIWAMHFTGMLALHLPAPVAYNVTMITLSLLVATSGSLIALWLTQPPKLRRPPMIAGAFSIGAAIAGLHFIDMAAIRMPARTLYSTPLVFASIVIAIILGFVGLWIGRRYKRDDPHRSWIAQWIGAAILAVAIIGQHYTAMAAASFYAAPEPPHWINGPALPATHIPQTVLLSTLMILSAALASAAFDRRRTARALVSLRLLSARENERRRIARVLHDDVGQLLTAVRLNLQRFTSQDRGSPDAIIRESLGLVDESLSRVRELSGELRPTVLDDLGLGEAVEWFATRQAERARYAVVVEKTLGGSRLPEALETAAFRIAQQALTNIARHAQAKTVHIEMSRDSQAIEMVIRDDGVGFDVAAATARARAGESLGLVDMAEIAEMVGGDLSITSVLGRGSTVRARFPSNLFH
jgi:NO-binding membrane sensor protein with MHYT domain